MIGFDRPLKARWIYETLRMVKVGEKPIIYNKPFEDIASELVGKEGKRKARTVIFRSFIYSFQDKKSKIENNIFIKWANEKSLDELRPLFLLKLLMDYEITRFVIQKFDVLVDASKIISTPNLTQKVIEKYGDRDVTKRALRAFLTTLIDFEILYRETKTSFHILPKKDLSEQQVKDFLILYSNYYLKSKMVDLKSIDDAFLYFFNFDSLIEVANKYNGQEWEYIRDTSRNLVLMK